MQSSLARRRFQRGSVFVRGKICKVWVARWREDVQDLDSDRPRRVYKSEVLGTLADYPTKRLAQRALERRLYKINSPTYRAKTLVTFEQFSESWKETVMLNHKPSSQQTEKIHLSAYLVPFFGEMPLSEIRVQTVQRFVAKLSLKPKTIRNILATFRMVWKTAESWGYVDHNALDGLMLPKLNRPTRRVFTREEIQKILGGAEEPFKTLFWLAAETGLRSGELLGLRVGDLDVANGLLKVRQSVWRGKAQTPKTTNAVRDVELSPALQEHLREFLVGRSDTTKYLFQSRTGKPLDGGFITEDKLRPILDRLGIPRGGMHAFRHANASLLLEAGVDPKTVQTRLGHATSGFTMEVYAHVISRSGNKRAAEILGAILGAAST